MNKFKEFYYKNRERIFTVLLISAPLIALLNAMQSGWGMLGTPIFLLVVESLPVILLVDFVYIFVKSLPHIIRYIEIKKLLKSDNTIKTEAEVAYIESKKINPIDTQYTVKLNYNVGGNFYIKDIKLMNAMLIRTGIKILILCDADAPEKMTIISEAKITQNFDEMYGVKGRIINIIAEGVLLVVYILALSAGI